MKDHTTCLYCKREIDLSRCWCLGKAEEHTDSHDFVAYGCVCEPRSTSLGAAADGGLLAERDAARTVGARS